jgi:hypothetical protein
VCDQNAEMVSDRMQYVAMADCRMTERAMHTVLDLGLLEKGEKRGNQQGLVTGHLKP